MRRREIGARPGPLPDENADRRGFRPTTRLGWWAVGLAAASVVLELAWQFLGPLGGFPGLACGLAGGVVALIAIRRRGERAVSVFLAFVPFANALVFVVGTTVAILIAVAQRVP